MLKKAQLLKVEFNFLFPFIFLNIWPLGEVGGNSCLSHFSFSDSYLKLTWLCIDIAQRIIRTYISRDFLLS